MKQDSSNEVESTLGRDTDLPSDTRDELVDVESETDDSDSRKFDAIVADEVEKTEQKTEPVTPPPRVEETVARPEPAPSRPDDTAGKSTEPVRPDGTSSPGVLILQWLTYAFWLWFGASLLVLAGLVLAYFVSSEPGSVIEYTTDPLAYSLAAVIVMFLIAASTDLVYSRFEPLRKAGAATVIMLIHAVVFSLLAVGSLVVAVFALVSMLITSSPTSSSDGPTVTLCVALVGLVAYGAMAFRTVFVGRFAHVRKFFWVLMVLATVGFITASVTGPTSHAMRTRDDRLIESALPTLQSDIEDYTMNNKKLPETLSEVSSNSYRRDEVQLLIDRGLVRYTANTKQPAADSGSSTRSGVMIWDDTGETMPESQNKTHHYSLCVTYREAKGQPKNYEERTIGTADGVDSMGMGKSLYSEVMEHPSGDHCYELTARSYGSSRAIYD